MNYRRAMQCCTITCLLGMSVPQMASADDGAGGSSEATECGPRETETSLDIARNEGTDGHDEIDDGGDAADDDSETVTTAQCVPPADVPEAPKALLLSASAAVTGGAAVLVIRRRAKAARPFRT